MKTFKVIEAFYTILCSIFNEAFFTIMYSIFTRNKDLFPTLKLLLTFIHVVLTTCYAPSIFWSKIGYPMGLKYIYWKTIIEELGKMFDEKTVKTIWTSVIMIFI